MNQPSFLMRASAILVGFSTAAFAGESSAADFYRGKELALYIGSDTGGGYDEYGRMVGRYLAKHLAGSPAFVPRNMPGAGGRRAFSYVFNVAPKDGTAIGTTLRTIPFDPILRSNEAFDYDATKVAWLGSANSEVSLCVTWHTVPVKTIEQARTRELVFGSSGPSSNETLQSLLLNSVAGTNIRVVQGYKGSTEIHLAMERGEMMGRCGFGWDSIQSRYSGWLKEKKINLLVQLALKKHPDLPDVPFIMDYATSDESRQIVELMIGPNEMGRPFYAPPGTPADRIAELRTAFEAALKDEGLLAEASKSSLGIAAMTGEDVAVMVKRIYMTPKPVQEKVVALLGKVEGEGK